LLDTAAEHPGAELRIRHEGRSGLVAAIERAVVDDPWLPPLTNQAANPGR
jgi:hypothetical protein